MDTRERVIVEGRVQGVFFRAETQKAARALGVRGWVRNLSDGRVEAVFEGDRSAVDHAVEWARHGPERALVTGVEVISEKPEGLTGFELRQ